MSPLIKIFGVITNDVMDKELDQLQKMQKPFLKIKAPLHLRNGRGFSVCFYGNFPREGTKIVVRFSQNKRLTEVSLFGTRQSILS